MNLPLWLASPASVTLFKWTCLLTLGWAAHGMLHGRHARWRLILWRGILGLGLVLPLLHFFPIPGIKIPIAGQAISATEPASPLSPLADGAGVQPAASAALPTQARAVAGPALAGARSLEIPAPPGPVAWDSILVGIWALGCVGGAVRLVRLQLQLNRLRNETCQPVPELQQLARQVQIRFEIRREVEVQVSDSVASPFVCGLLRPAIILPRALAQNFSAREVSTLLSHELAHVRQHDLVWCVAWQWMKAAWWFHPLVWKIPAAHNLACEQEADRIAARQWADRDAYARLLARFALRVLALPAVETRLTVNGSSQIARRLTHLDQPGIGTWNWRHSVAGFGLVGCLFLITAGCEFSQTSPAGSKGSTPVEFKEVRIVVQDEDGKPIEGATLQPDGLRVKGRHRASHYGWDPKLHGAPAKVTTDHEGKAYVKYPVQAFPEEKLMTGEISFSVSHPDFSRARPTEFAVDGTAKPIRLTAGIHLEVGGVSGIDRQPVTELAPNLSEPGSRPEVWQKKESGGYAFHQLSPGGHLLQLMGRLPSGEIVYSTGWAFTAEKGKQYNFALEMKPGIRLEGRIDDQVPRPVKNGRVLISVRPKEFPAFLVPEDYRDLTEKYGYFYFWKSYRPLAEDGSFVFESIPPGEVDVIVHGDGFVSKSIGQVQNRILVDAQARTTQLVAGPSIGIPQPFALVAPITKVVVVTEPTATLNVTAKTKWGKPIAGARVYLNPNVLRMQTGIFGEMSRSNEEPFHRMAALPDLSYSATTDQEGVAVIRNVPAITRGMDVDHPQFHVPLQDPKGWRDRHLRIKLLPGATNRVELTLEPKGKNFVGSN